MARKLMKIRGKYYLCIFVYIVQIQVGLQTEYGHLYPVLKCWNWNRKPDGMIEIR